MHTEVTKHSTRAVMIRHATQGGDSRCADTQLSFGSQHDRAVVARTECCCPTPGQESMYVDEAQVPSPEPEIGNLRCMSS